MGPDAGGRERPCAERPRRALFFDGGLSVGDSGNIAASWRAPDMVTQPDPVGQRWNIQLPLTPVLPKLITGTLFD